MRGKGPGCLPNLDSLCFLANTVVKGEEEEDDQKLTESSPFQVLRPPGQLQTDAEVGRADGIRGRKCQSLRGESSARGP